MASQKLQKTNGYLSSLAKCNLALMALSLILSTKFTSAQTAGTLDPSFGTGGRVTTFFGGDGLNGDDAYSIAVQTDGKLVVTGITTNLDNTTDFGLARYNSNGTLDSTFGTGGKVKTNFGNFDGVRALAIQSNGKIVVAGYTLVNFSPDFGLARYNSNGTLDPTFGVGGKVITDLGGPALSLPDKHEQAGETQLSKTAITLAALASVIEVLTTMAQFPLTDLPLLSK